MEFNFHKARKFYIALIPALALIAGELGLEQVVTVDALQGFGNWLYAAIGLGAAAGVNRFANQG